MIPVQPRCHKINLRFSKFFSVAGRKTKLNHFTLDACFLTRLQTFHLQDPSLLCH